MMRPSAERQAADIFAKAAAYIRTYGWQEVGMSEHGRPRCSMGALASAHDERVWDSEVAALMYQTLNRKLSGVGLTEFNRRASGGEDVARLFEQVAAELCEAAVHVPY